MTDHGTLSFPVDSVAPKLQPSVDGSQPSVVDRIPIDMGDGRTRWLSCDFEQMDQIEAQFKMPAWGVGVWQALTKNHHAVAKALAIFLKRDDPEITEEKVKALPRFNLPNMNYIQGQINLLWGATFVQAKDAEGKGDGSLVGDADPNGGNGSVISMPTSEPDMG